MTEVESLNKRERVIGITLFVAVGFSLLFHAGFQRVMADQLVAQATAAPKLPPSRIRLMEDLNQARAQNGISPLTEDTRLDNSAQTKADDMVTRNYYDHPDPDGKQGYTYAEAAIPSCTYISENLVEASSASDALSQWMNSPPHKAALLDPKYSLTGFGVAVHGSYFYVVEHFCQLPTGTSVKSVAQSPSYAPYTLSPLTVPKPYVPAPYSSTPYTAPTPSKVVPTGPSQAELDAQRQERIQSCLRYLGAHGAGDSSAAQQCYTIQ